MYMSFIEAISNFYPVYQVSANGPDYNNIDWNGYPPISEQELSQKIIRFAKDSKIQELSDNCQREIISGFRSNALGEWRIYDSEEVDQLNLIGAVAAIAPSTNEVNGGTIYYASRSIPNNQKSYDLHTYYQLKQVLSDGANVKLINLQKFFVLRAQVESTEITNISEISKLDTIMWA